jgi:nitrate reductase alpha subunit
MRAFGEGFVVYRPPVDLKTITKAVNNDAAEGQPACRAELHHAAPEMGHPFDLYRQPSDADAEPRRAGGLDVRGDAKKAGLVDNDWVEAYNINGALTARVVVSQRIKEGTLSCITRRKRS